ncbi:MAG: von Willebrand factor type A domain-containing protein [Planctomycetes bacterium]|nr:von Willebrand factor type A domain-containing protein [Planctomycetota bacterium]
MTQPDHDVLLTSYALDEFQGEDLARIERLLAEDPAARQRVAELRALAALLSDELGAQAAPGLDASRRAEIERAAVAPRGRLLRLDARPWAVAAAILIALGGVIGFGLGGRPRDEAGRKVADLDPADRRDEGFRARRIVDDARSESGSEVRRDQDLLATVDRHAGEAPVPVDHTMRAPAAEHERLLAEDPSASAAQGGTKIGIVTTPAVQTEAPNKVLAVAGKAKGQVVPGAEPMDARAKNDLIGLGGGASGAFGGMDRERSKTAGPGSTRPPARPGSPTPPASPGGFAPTGSGSPGPGPAGGGYVGPQPKPSGAPTQVGGEVANSARSAEVGLDPALGNSEEGLRRRSVDLSRQLEDLKVDAAKLPEANRRRYLKSIDDLATQHNQELAGRVEALDALREANAAKEELLEAQADPLAEELAEVTQRYEELLSNGSREVEKNDRKYRILRRLVEDELRRVAGESYSSVDEQPFKPALAEPLSTIGLDVDTASYANVRRFLSGGQWPPRDAVRVDEMVNYFRYADAAPEAGENLAIHAEVAACPWNLNNRLLRVAFKAKEIDRNARGATSLVFLVDVSGSMRSNDKLPLLKEGLKALTRQLGEDDAVAIVTYASGVRVALEPTFGNEQARILGVLDSLEAGGSTNGAGGIQLAYETARKAFVDGGTNRVILCTDGDFNVGVSDTEELSRMLEHEAKSGIFLSVLGFGTGNLQDGRMQSLANRGNGHYAYIDSRREAEKVLVEELVGTLMTVAKDAKLQIEFNPFEVASWRLLGYSARILEAQDFNDDKKDAGEIGAGHSVVALYEIVTRRAGDDLTPKVDPLAFQRQPELTNLGKPGEIAKVKLRYKLPDAEKSRLRSLDVIDDGRHYGSASVDFKLSASVALFGQLLFRSPHVAQASLEAAEELAMESFVPEKDPRGLRPELVELIKKAIAIRDGRPQKEGPVER